MEHLPKPTGQTKSLFPAIPYLCENRYDGGPFLNYPHRLGVPNLEIDGTFSPNPTLSSASQELLAAAQPAALEKFLQTWLFFGLLHEILGGSYRHEDFVTTVSNGEVEKIVVTTADLLSRLEEWEANITQDKGSLYEHIANCLRLTHACLVIEYPAFDNDLKFHLASVAEVLGYATSKACNVAWTDSPHRSLIPRDWHQIISEDFRKLVLLKRSNCCPSQMQMLMHDFGSPQALGFVAGCFQDDVTQSPPASCDGNHCQAGVSETPGQSPRHIPHHVSDSCECDLLRVDERKVADCLKKGCLPLLRLKKETDSDMMSIEVVASTDSTSYVALSHVWADGLGNSTANALPRCQLSRLKALIDNLDFEYLDDPPEDVPEMLLWCDTLCCPVAPEEAKNMALRQMYRTYDKASVVLVLDRSFISNRVGGMSLDEACIRIAASRWMTRLWTLQEGALPALRNKLWFQFTKTAIPLWTLYKHLVKVSETDIRMRGVVDSVIGRFHTFTSLFDVQSGESRGAQMKNIMRGLLYRSVTVPSDEPLIIATLLALDLRQILEPEPADRMHALWRIIGTHRSGIDKQILFHVGRKIHERGLRWAPKSLLPGDRDFAVPIADEQENRGFLSTNPNARGLVVELAGFRISLAKPAKGSPQHLAGFDSTPRNDNARHQLLLKDNQGRWYLLAHRLLGTSDYPPAPEEISAVISRIPSPWILYRGSRSSVPANTKGHLGLLVEKANEQQLQGDEATCVEIKSQVGFCHLATEMNQICQTAYCLAQELASSAAARRLEALETAPPDDPVYQDAFQGLLLESQRLSRSPFAMEALAASGNSADERDTTRIEEYMARIYRGMYMQIEEYAPGNRKWCVD